MSPQELLLKAADLIDSPARWTRGTMARDRHGVEVLTCDADARRWCAVGALERLAPDRETYSAAINLAHSGHTFGLTDINDRRGMTSKRMAEFLRRAAS